MKPVPHEITDTVRCGHHNVRLWNDKHWTGTSLNSRSTTQPHEWCNQTTPFDMVQQRLASWWLLVLLFTRIRHCDPNDKAIKMALLSHLAEVLYTDMFLPQGSSHLEGRVTK